MAACAGYSTCSIRFIPNNKKQNQHEYSDRSTIEIRQHDCGNYSLRAIDVTNNKTEIFDIQLTSKRQYQVGSTADDPDKVETKLGTYYLSLARPMRKNFHKDLRKCFNEIAFISESSESPLEIDSDDDEYPMFDESYKNSDDDYDDDVNTIPAPDFLLSSSPPFRSRHSDIVDSMPLSRPPPLRSELNSASSEPNLTFLKTNPSNDFRKANPVSTPPKLEPAIVPPTDLLHDTHSLGKFISNGNENEAARIATSLCQHSVQLQVKSLKTKKNDKKFTIQIQIDGNEYSLDQSGPKVSVNVYQSTTVRELRAAFEFAYQQLPPSQYFFVNGALAHDDSSMQDLNVGSGTVFVLFLLTHLKKI